MLTLFLMNDKVDSDIFLPEIKLVLLTCSLTLPEFYELRIESIKFLEYDRREDRIGRIIRLFTVVFEDTTVFALTKVHPLSVAFVIPAAV